MVADICPWLCHKTGTQLLQAFVLGNVIKQEQRWWQAFVLGNVIKQEHKWWQEYLFNTCILLV